MELKILYDGQRYNTVLVPLTIPYDRDCFTKHLQVSYNGDRYDTVPAFSLEYRAMEIALAAALEYRMREIVHDTTVAIPICGSVWRDSKLRRCNAVVVVVVVVVVAEII